MLNLYVKVRTWMDSDEGATALEYGILVALIALVIIVGVGLFGGALNTFFGGIAGQVKGMNNPTTP
ncbi:MAG: Flp family type IVb pilin [Anaerosomatales bacterium]|nr:Flp family type IVb pilin [Anaerosomatales bacterium]